MEVPIISAHRRAATGPSYPVAPSQPVLVLVATGGTTTRASSARATASPEAVPSASSATRVREALPLASHLSRASLRALPSYNGQPLKRPQPFRAIERDGRAAGPGSETPPC